MSGLASNYFRIRALLSTPDFGLREAKSRKMRLPSAFVFGRQANETYAAMLTTADEVGDWGLAQRLVAALQTEETSTDAITLRAHAHSRTFRSLLETSASEECWPHKEACGWCLHVAVNAAVHA